MILMIDDDTFFTSAYPMLFERRGYVYEFVSDPEDVLDFIKKQGKYVSVLILDIMLPAMGQYENEDPMLLGYTLLGEAWEAIPDLKVIILTNRENDPNREDISRDSRVVGYVQKSEEDALARVDSLLKVHYKPKAS